MQLRCGGKRDVVATGISQAQAAEEGQVSRRLQGLAILVCPETKGPRLTARRLADVAELDLFSLAIYYRNLLLGGSGVDPIRLCWRGFGDDISAGVYLSADRAGCTCFAREYDDIVSFSGDGVGPAAD